ncbi:MAG TPA: hypothetical protein VN132_00145, partial [Bdellovibrio sp.]|nr:hypothetical protein [Bdellovibrio sp.]
MRNLFLSLIMITTLASSITWAQAPEDQPAPDEAFSSFFARITHGGSFPGIRFDAPVDFQEFFLTRIRRGNWVASLYQARKQITNAGGDLWNSFYKAEKIGNLLFPTTELNQKFQQAYDSFISTQCQRGCRPWNTLQQISFSQWTAGEREAFALSYVTKAAVFKDRTVLDFLGDRYEMKSEEVNGRFRFELLNDQDFKKAVKDLGWTGEIYFRGITIPDPKNPQSRIILMNDDSIKAQTTYQAPLLQALEYVGILTHEISHVFQDRESTKLGLDLEIRSAEGALLIEGGAEFEAE